jgi:hypothetical protein
MYIGGDPSIIINNNCNISKSSYSSGFGTFYETPNGMQPTSEEAKKYLAGE